MLRIGLSACFFHADPQRAIFKGKTLQYLEQSLAHWVMQEGVKLYLIPAPPPGGKAGLAELVNDFDGLVLQGGSDVAPQSYGEAPIKPEWQGDFVRDRYEIALYREFQTRGKPVLGICRGAQLLNVAHGGTLLQDITTQVPGALVHRDWNIYDQNFHEITFEPGAWLAQLHGATGGRVNSVHHQGIKTLGQGLVVEARSTADGLIEAIRGDEKQKAFVYAVQWHPEFHAAESSLLEGRLILRKFLSACQASHG